MAIRKIYKGSSVVNNLSVGSSAVKKVVVTNTAAFGTTVYENYDTLITIVTPDDTPVEELKVNAGGDLSVYLSLAYDWKSEEYMSSDNLYYYDVSSVFHVYTFDEFGYEINSFTVDKDDFESELTANNCIVSGSHYHIVVEIEETVKEPVYLSVDAYYYMNSSNGGFVKTFTVQKGTTYSTIINDSSRPATKTYTSGNYRYTYTYKHLRWDDSTSTTDSISSSTQILSSRAVEWLYSESRTYIGGSTPSEPSEPTTCGVYLKDKNGTWHEFFTGVSSANNYSARSGSMEISGSSGALDGYTYTAKLNFKVISLSNRKTAMCSSKSNNAYVCNGVYYSSNLSTQTYIMGGVTGTSTVAVGAYYTGTYDLGSDWMYLRHAISDATLWQDTRDITNRYSITWNCNGGGMAGD